MIKITNLVNQHKKMAEQFLAQLRESRAVPNKFSGLMTPRFGQYLFIWQFNNNKLVGATAIHINNAENFTKKIENALTGPDWASTVTRPEITKEDDGQRDSANAK